MNGMSDPIAACREVLERSGSSFATAFRMLPAEPCAGLTAFYAFCRAVDDEVDGANDAETARRHIAAWRERLAGRPADGVSAPIMQGLAWARARFGIRQDHLELILAGVERDLGEVRFEDFGELYAYCYRVASAVGLVCVTILAPDESRRLETYAELTGVAVQLTNVLRDVGEDARRGRIYLPLCDLRDCGVSESDLLACRRTPAVERLLAFEARRAADYYELAGAALPPDLRPRLFFAEILRATYRRLLARIESEGRPVLERRVSLGKIERVVVALRHRLDPRTLAA
jgi:phytoene synthase